VFLPEWRYARGHDQPPRTCGDRARAVEAGSRTPPEDLPISTTTCGPRAAPSSQPRHHLLHTYRKPHLLSSPHPVGAFLTSTRRSRSLLSVSAMLFFFTGPVLRETSWPRKPFARPQMTCEGGYSATCMTPGQADSILASGPIVPGKGECNAVRYTSVSGLQYHPPPAATKRTSSPRSEPSLFTAPYSC
jgi:hypothetical protein